jgi:hypothetical protein
VTRCIFAKAQPFYRPEEELKDFLSPFSGPFFVTAENAGRKKAKKSR